MKELIKAVRIKTEPSDYGSDGIIKQEVLEKKLRNVAELAIRKNTQRRYTIQLRSDSGNSMKTTAWISLFDKVSSNPDEWCLLAGDDYEPDYAKTGMGLACSCKDGKYRHAIYDARLDGTSEYNTRYDLIAEKLISDIR